MGGTRTQAQLKHGGALPADERPSLSANSSSRGGHIGSDPAQQQLFSSSSSASSSAASFLSLLRPRPSPPQLVGRSEWRCGATSRRPRPRAPLGPTPCGAPDKWERWFVSNASVVPPPSRHHPSRVRSPPPFYVPRTVSIIIIGPPGAAQINRWPRCCAGEPARRCGPRTVCATATPTLRPPPSPTTQPSPPPPLRPLPRLRRRRWS